MASPPKSHSYRPYYRPIILLATFLETPSRSVLIERESHFNLQLFRLLWTLCSCQLSMMALFKWSDIRKICGCLDFGAFEGSTDTVLIFVNIVDLGFGCLMFVLSPELQSFTTWLCGFLITLMGSTSHGVRFSSTICLVFEMFTINIAKAQRTRGLSSAYQSKLLKVLSQILTQSLIKFHFQNLDQGKYQLQNLNQKQHFN